jgi:hypothetical protein
MRNLGTWEAVGQLLSAGAAFYGLVYIAPNLVLLALSSRSLQFVTSPEGAAGLAGLALAASGSFVALILSQIKSADSGVGVTLLFWINFVILAFGDILFYFVAPAATPVMLFGGASAVITVIGIMVITQRQPKTIQGNY